MEDQEGRSTNAQGVKYTHRYYLQTSPQTAYLERWKRKSSRRHTECQEALQNACDVSVPLSAAAVTIPTCAGTSLHTSKASDHLPNVIVRYNDGNA